jgi:HEAT repeats
MFGVRIVPEAGVMAAASPGIGGVDWAAVSHAYGPATDMPGLLAALRSPHAKSRATARGGLYNNLRHQGTLYPAAAVTAPFLLELAADPQLPERHKVVALLAHLAVGYDEEWLPATIPITKIRSRLPAAAIVEQPGWLRQFTAQELRRWRAEVGGPDNDAWRELFAMDPAELWWGLDVPVDQDDDPWMDRRLLTTWLPHVYGWLACYDAVRAGVALFQQLLSDTDPRMRAEAAYALAWFAEHADPSVPALIGAVDGEQEPMVAATILVAVGLLTDPADRQVQALLDEQLSDHTAWRRWGAAAALAVQAGRSPGMVGSDRRVERAVFELARGIRQHPPPACDDELWPPWLFGDTRGLSALCLARLGPTAVRHTIPAIAAALPDVDARDGFHLVRGLLHAAFPDGPPGAPPRPDQLTALQHQAVAALIAAPDALRLSNTMNVSSSYKLTHLFLDHDPRL